MKKLTTLILTGFITVSSLGQVFASSSNASPVKTDVSLYVDGRSIGNVVQPVMVNGRILVPVSSLIKELGAEMKWNENERLLQVQKKNVSISMKVGDNNALVNSATKRMDTVPVVIDNTVMAPVRFIAEELKYIVNWNSDENSVTIDSASTGTNISRGGEARKQNVVVVIDAGHGGSETGAIYGGINEKDLNLDIAIRLNELLKKQGIKTYMTRVDDSYVSLYVRSGLANKLNADLLVSVHNNAGMSGTSGSMALYYPGKNNFRGDLTARNFASIVQKELTGNLKTINMGVIPRPNLAVLRTAKMPAVIAEVAYMTNKGELSKLKSSSFKQKAAEALKNAVLSALKEK